MAKKNSPNRYTTILAHWIQQQQPVAVYCVILHMAKCALLLYFVYHAHPGWRIKGEMENRILLPCTAFGMHTDEINTQTDDIRAPLFFFCIFIRLPFFFFFILTGGNRFALSWNSTKSELHTQFEGGHFFFQLDMDLVLLYTHRAWPKV
jgi:hypothetical protein